MIIFVTTMLFRHLSLRDDLRLVDHHTKMVYLPSKIADQSLGWQQTTDLPKPTLELKFDSGGNAPVTCRSAADGCQ